MKFQFYRYNTDSFGLAITTVRWPAMIHDYWPHYCVEVQLGKRIYALELHLTNKDARYG